MRCTEYFTYGDARHTSPGAFDQAGAHTISLFSLSKAYGLAGWRVGYMLYPERLADAVAKVQDTILVCPTVISQVAAVEAMRVGPAYPAQFLRGFADIRDIVIGELRSLGRLCVVPPADGAFYCFIRLNADFPPMQVAERLIREHRVAIIPGDAFGMTEGCYFRVAFGALQKATVSEGMGRLVSGLRQIVNNP